MDKPKLEEVSKDDLKLINNRIRDMKTVNVSVDLGKIVDISKIDIPVSFICGKEMISSIGLISPERGIVVYLFKEYEIKKHGSDWIPDLTLSNNTLGGCLPDEIEYEQYIKNFYNISEICSWDCKTLSKT